MKIVWKWLQEYADIPWEPEEAAEMLTMAGLKVESLSCERALLSGVVAAQVLDVVPHPKRPDLKVGTLCDGNQNFFVVSGAPGLSKGNVTLLAKPGSSLPGGITVSPVEFEGVLSQGMVVCSNEILLGEPHRPGEDIVMLPRGTPLGKVAQDLLGLDDYVLELELTVNFSHCLSILGVAMEAAALAKTSLKLPKILKDWDWASHFGSRRPSGAKNYSGQFAVELPDPDLCPRYVAKGVRNVKVGYSPVWMERRLQLAGMRPINSIVDATNYIMLETGQPLHAFDLDRLEGGVLRPRRSKPGEVIVTLDGESRELAPGTLVIADGGGPVAVAGVMGNRDTEVTESTANLLIESAYFAPLPVRRTYRGMKLRTEAALRFEKGVDPTAQGAVAERTAALVAELTGGIPEEGYAEATELDPKPLRLQFRVGEARRTLGLAISQEECRGILQSLNFGVFRGEGPEAGLDITVPPRRVDIEEEIDLVEEIARHYGVNRFQPLDLDKAVPGGPPGTDYVRRSRIKDILVSLGGLECVTNSLLAPGDISVMGWDGDDPRGKPVELLNPLSSNESVLRPSLLPGLAKVAVLNQRKKADGGLFWEMGTVFLPSPEELPYETAQLGLMSYGIIKPKTWVQEQENASFYGLKGVVESLLSLLGVCNVSYIPRAGMPFHPGKSARIVVRGSTVGEMGELHPVSQNGLESAASLLMAWFSLDALLALAQEHSYDEVSRFMPVQRDLAVVVLESVPVGDIARCVRESARDLVSLDIFDLWKKLPVPPGKKSVAMRLVYQAADRTLTEAELQEDRKRVLRVLSDKFSAEQRL